MGKNDWDFSNINNQIDLAKADLSQDINKMIEKNARIVKAIGPTIDAIRKVSEEYAPFINAVKDLRELIRDQYPVVKQNGRLSFYEGIHQACLINTNYGWCLSSNVSISAYRRIASSEDSQEEKDRLFVLEFEADNFDLYIAEKNHIIITSNQEWREFYEECFYLIDNGKYQAAIPSLMSAVEHELAFEGTNDIGKPLINRVKSSLEREEDRNSFLYAISTSVISLLNNRIFKYRDFSRQRLSIINRNWVLHGRDKPSLWKKEDVYKLIALISALRMLNRRFE
ncbi:hypothetical protein QUF95_07185 [Paenibacillus silvae]|uniref:hypothetical protein n=1 Tax=Paenibacillus silvae TaxID=1325358 RepID=UPI0025A168D7|nr:hypothetical protein [Paenibacillus silvae]MDM5277159.1 hypothetical protein [Paenibacillus silvae]